MTDLMIEHAPPEWARLRLGQVFKERKTTVSDTDYPPLSVTMNGIVPQLDTAAKTDNNDNRKLVLAGDYVINSRSDRKGSGGISDRDGSVSVISIVLEPQGIDREFAHFLLRSRTFQEEFYRWGSGIVADLWSTRYSDMKNIRLALPPLAEQRTIAAYLDRETGRIDALVERLERLIALLTEKRQAVISRAVTKGLDPCAPMKDSGIDWLGEVPAHWEVGKLLRYARLESGHTPNRGTPEYWEHCVHPWVSLADVCQFRDSFLTEISETSEKISELGLANSAARLLPKGTVILSRTASVGFATKLGATMATTQDFVNWVCGSELSPDYLLATFWAMKPEFERLKYGSTHNTIYMPDVRAFVTCVPPLAEQRAIVAKLTTDLADLKKSLERAHQGLGLLRERRAALISAAVTGQIPLSEMEAA